MVRSDADADDAALRRFLEGDDAGFEEIARRHQDRVYRTSLGLLGDAELARDAAQTVFLRAFTGLRRWRFEARLSTWLYRTCVNVCRELHRRRRSESSKLQRLATLVRGEGVAQAALEAYATPRLLLELPPRQREVVTLRVVEELSVSETAAALAIPEGTVKSNYHKAMQRLRASVEERVAPSEEQPCPG